ncbi:hypothetical protein PLICRDRAFT_40845 [Plicaturopsis crispa FD-325 SS-3]|nr:hypothetical protein PLICRDRAFT_40845 [Plicaturopsis crispa FD-325 SS-3]
MSDTPYTEAWLEGPRSTQFYTRTYAASEPKAVVVALHGFIEHCGRHAHVHAAWAARGITVFAYDQRGFGRTALDEEHKSKDSAYAKTSWAEQFTDIEWAVRYAKSTYGLPTFLMGQSMSGGLVSAFPTRASAPPSPEAVSLLSGVISTSPLFTPVTPIARPLRWIMSAFSVLLPATTTPVDFVSSRLSHDTVMNDSFTNDPLVRKLGSVRGFNDMIGGGEGMLQNDYKRWPVDLPVIYFHGTADEITSAKSTEEFYNKIPAKDKKLVLYEGALHELQNEPDGVKERFIDESVAWIEAHLPSAR